MKGAMCVILVIIVFSSLTNAVELEKSYLCNATYFGIIENKTNNQIINEILEEKKYGVSNEIIEYYKSNWKEICEEEILRTLNPEPLCKKLYYFILSNNWEYSESDLKNLGNQLGESFNVTKEYLIENYELCYLNGYTDKFPKIPEGDEIIIKRNQYCDLSLSDFFEESAPFFSFSIGDIPCPFAKFLRVFFNLEQIKDTYKIIGIRLWWVLSLIILIPIIITLKSKRLTDKVLRKISKKENLKSPLSY